MIYTPDAWVLIKTPDCVKVLAGWKGGYLNGDEWRLSSGVTKIEDADNCWKMTNHSGSIYYCVKHLSGVMSIMADTYKTLTDNGCIEIEVKDYVQD